MSEVIGLRVMSRPYGWQLCLVWLKENYAAVAVDKIDRIRMADGVIYKINQIHPDALLVESMAKAVDAPVRATGCVNQNRLYWHARVSLKIAWAEWLKELRQPAPRD